MSESVVTGRHTKRVGMIQPNYVPWRGYFDFIDDVDHFVFYDDVQMGRGKKWRNRNLIRTPHGRQWLTVPLRHGQGARTIHQVEIDYSSNWIDRHLNLLHASYRLAPYWRVYEAPFAEILRRRYEHVADLDIDVSHWIMSALGISTLTCRARDFAVPPCDKVSRPLRFLELLGATAYLCGPTSLAYTNVNEYERRGIELELKVYDYPAHAQVGRTFDGSVSVLDLLFNEGPNARRFLKSNVPSRLVWGRPGQQRSIAPVER